MPPQSASSRWRWLPSPRSSIACFAATLLAVIGLKHFVFDSDPAKCQALVTAGQWHNSRDWLVPGCTTIDYHQSRMQKCAAGSRSSGSSGAGKRKFVFVGDLHTQRLYFQTGRRIDRDVKIPENREQDLRMRGEGYEVQFFWDPYLNGSGFRETSAAFLGDGKSDRALFTVVGAANAHVEKGMSEEYVAKVTKLAKSKQVSAKRFSYCDGPGDLLLFAPAEEPHKDHSEGSPDANPYRKLNDMLAEVAGASVLWSFRKMTSERKDAYKDGNTKVKDDVIRRRVDVLLNLRCNSAIGRTGHFPNQAVCCGVWRGPNWFQTAFLVVSLAVLPLVVLLDLQLAFLSEAPRLVVRAFCAFASVVSLQWVADRTHVFDQATRLGFVKSNLYAMMAVTFFFGLATIRRSKPARKPGTGEVTPNQPFLPRDQTDEWKGWMQAMILIYHYNKGWKFLELWEVIRLTVASYLFLTGFGHTVYFLQKKDYSLKRVTNVMVRTNLLPVTLAYVMRTRWLLYYYMPLSTFNFLVVYATLAVGRRYNEYTVFLIGKITAAALLVHTFLTTKNLAATVVRFFQITCKLDFDSDEFFGHRVKQDQYIVFVGMISAILYIHVRAVVEKAEHRDRLSEAVRKVWPGLRWCAVILAGVGHAGFWYWVRTHISDENGFSKLQPYITALPIVTFAVLRNAHPTLRNWHSVAFAWLGRYSGEMYVMQDHLWLSNDQRATLRTGFFHGDETLLGDKWRDVVLVTPLYLLACSLVGDATGVIAEWFTKEDPQLPQESTALVAEVEMGLLIGEGITSDDDDLTINEKAKSTSSWWSRTASRLPSRRYWPRRLRHRVMLVLAIMWALNMTYT